MSILKTYYVQIRNDDRTLDDLYVKARSLKEADSKALELRPEDYCPGTIERATAKSVSLEWSRHYSDRNKPFCSGGYRVAGKFIYRHKGRKKKGRKNYGRLPWACPPITITYTETYSKAFCDLMDGWFQQLIVQPAANDDVALATT